MKHLIYLFFLCICTISFGQDLVYSGKVLDQSNQPITYTNIVLYKLNKTEVTLTKGVSTNEEGFFKIEALESGKYRVTASFIGYKTIDKEFCLIKTPKRLLC